MFSEVEDGAREECNGRNGEKTGWDMPTEARSQRALCAMVRSWNLTLKIPTGEFYE